MSTLVVLFGSLLIFRGLGAVGVDGFSAWSACERFALSTMFLFTAASHFTSMRGDLIAMVPPELPRPDVLVSITGVAEFAGAVGLMIPSLRFWAAVGLILLLIAMLPANISAAQRGVRLRGRAPTPLWIRMPMQILFIGWAWIVR